jgi:hypothetical protein
MRASRLCNQGVIRKKTERSRKAVYRRIRLEGAVLPDLVLSGLDEKVPLKHPESDLKVVVDGEVDVRYSGSTFRVASPLT